MSVCQTSVLVRWRERENWTPCAVLNYIKAVCVDVGRSMGHITSHCAVCVLGHVCIVRTVSVFVLCVFVYLSASWQHTTYQDPTGWTWGCGALGALFL